MSKGIKSIFSLGDDVLFSECDPSKNNTIMVQVGDATVDAQNTTGGSPAEWWQHVGFASRPSPVSGTGKSADAAQAVVINHTHSDVVIASRDVRYQSIYGSLKQGETALYATGSDGKGQARILLKQDGSINLFTKKNNLSANKGLGLFIAAKEDSISLINSTGSAVQVDSSGTRMFSSAGSVDVGSAVKITSTGAVNISGTSVVLGGAAAQPALNTIDLTALISAITAALGAVTTPGGGPAVQAAWSAASAAVLAAAQTKRTRLE